MSHPARMGKRTGGRADTWVAGAATVACVALWACAGAGGLGGVDDARLRQAAREAGSWLTHGRTYDEQRFSPLEQIHDANAGELGLVWSFDLETTRGVESTPLVADGVMYVTGPWSVVHALDARTGGHLWSFDPTNTRARARVTCCGVPNRGVALYEGRIYVGTLAGELVALDAATGEVAWRVQTTDPAKPYTITGAPRVVEGNVVIGNGGAEFGVRGYVSAYDARTGSLAWRTFTVPGDPSQPFESEALARAARTWSGEWWRLGGGGTAWDSMAYDPELDLLYVGTGNGSPQVRELRSPGGGDNLFLSSILALRPSSGELVWHFQTTPADSWDYTATQPMILADLEVDGELRPVLMQAPKNGFFYVLDRRTGAFLSARPYARVTWARGVDAAGRPIETPEAGYRERGRMIMPGPFGAHNWQPMSFHPGTGLVYFPVTEMPAFYQRDPAFAPQAGTLNTGLDSRIMVQGPSDGHAALEFSGRLVAWDPVGQREAWRVPHATAFSGGTLATAGNLVFQGTADGRFAAYRATDGERLWAVRAGTGIMAAPVTYELDGVQYVAIAAGWGSSFAPSPEDATRGAGRVLVFALGGQATIPPPPPVPGPVTLPDVEIDAGPEQIERGGLLYARYCMHCHGPMASGAGMIPDLRRASPETHRRFRDIVLGGLRADRGMPSFADVLGREDADHLQAYLLELTRRAAGAAVPSTQEVRP